MDTYLFQAICAQHSTVCSR